LQSGFGSVRISSGIVIETTPSMGSEGGVGSTGGDFRQGEPVSAGEPVADLGGASLRTAVRGSGDS
ncbi:unnamed protein product, partial [Brassica oleracea]